MEAFNLLNVENWSGNDCFDWATYVNEEHNLNIGSDIINQFSRLTGNELLEFGIDGFCQNIDDGEGPKFYRLFREFIDKRSSVDAIGGTKPFWETFEESPTGYSDPLFSTLMEVVPNLETYKQNVSEDQVKEQDSKSANRDLQATDVFALETVPPNYNVSDMYANQPTSSYSLSMGASARGSPLDFETGYYSDNYSQMNCTATVQIPSHNQQFSNMTLNDDESSFEEDDISPSRFKKESTYRKDRKRSIKAWEYLLELLKDPKYNPSVIRWEDEINGVFRLVQKDSIAIMWGQRKLKGRKKDGDMSADSFAKVIRTYYKKEYKNKSVIENMPQNHVYKFGEEIMKDFRAGIL